jgi:DNA repair exonuclease SbcCD ATPase subunit
VSQRVAEISGQLLPAETVQQLQAIVHRHQTQAELEDDIETARRRLGEAEALETSSYAKLVAASDAMTPIGEKLQKAPDAERTVSECLNLHQQLSKWETTYENRKASVATARARRAALVGLDEITPRSEQAYFQRAQVTTRITELQQLQRMSPDLAKVGSQSGKCKMCGQPLDATHVQEMHKEYRERQRRLSALEQELAGLEKIIAECATAKADYDEATRACVFADQQLLDWEKHKPKAVPTMPAAKATRVREGIAAMRQQYAQMEKDYKVLTGNHVQAQLAVSRWASELA